MQYPGNCASPKATAQYFAHVAREEFGLPAILPVMASCVELTDAWTSEGCVDNVPGYHYAVDHDSLGFFQQRPAAGWGTPEQLTDADYALRAFCKEAVRQWRDCAADDAECLGYWCAAVQRPREDLRYLYASKGYPLAKRLLGEEEGEAVAKVKAQDVVAAARMLLGAPYRWWHEGEPVPLWWGSARPSAAQVKRTGIHCSDLLNWARQECGLDPVGGTGAYADALVDWQYYDPSAPGVPGALCVKPYSNAFVQGHVGMMTGAYSMIQALVSDGVTEDYTDSETYHWGGETAFVYYGLMPDVDYSEQGDSDGTTSYRWVAVDSSGWLRADGNDWSGGWWSLPDWIFHRS